MGISKKISAVVVALAIVTTSLVPAFAATYTTENGDKAVVLNKLDLYAGTSTDAFVPSLEAQLTRGQGAVLLAKLFNMDSDAMALTDEEANAILKDFADADKVPSYAKKRLAYLVKNNIMSGSLDTATGKLFINAGESLLGGQFATLVLKQMGFTVASWSDAIAQLSGIDGAKDIAEYEAFATKALLRDQAVGIMHGSLTAKFSDKAATIIEKIIAAKPQLKDVAVANGLIKAVDAKALDVDSAAALNSKVVEISLKTAATAADVTATTFAVKDSAGKAINVVSAALAPWSDKAVIVTLESDTTAGTLYTLTAGDKAFNFGGKPVDTAKPGAPTVTATDANEVTITFDEAVKLETLKIDIAESYGTKAALAVNGMKYDGNNKIVLSVGDMKDSTLYKYTITNVTDLAGNQLENNKAENTFVGLAKSTADQVVKNVSALDYKTVYVEFAVNVDPATIAAANFTLAEVYESKANIAIADAKVPTADQTFKYNSANNTDVLKAAAAKKGVVLTLTGEVKSATLYKLTAANVKTLYGKALSTTEGDNYKTFSGISKPDADSMTYTVSAASNTEVVLTFANELDKTTAENVANYSIAKENGDKAALTISKAQVDPDNAKKVKLTVSAMAVDMYKVTATGIKDIYGNSIKTTSDANIQKFAGREVASKITSFIPVDDSQSTGKITVTFDRSYGVGALDASSYTLDNGIGYPSKVTAVTGSTTAVELTIPKTVIGKVYKLTVKNVKNSDGVAMDTAGISRTFIGNDEAAAAVKLENAISVNDKTIKLYFTKAIKDISDLNALKEAGTLASAFSLTGAKVQPDKAIVDETNDHAIILYTATANGFENDAGSTITVTATSTALDPDYDSIVVAENTSDATDIKVEGIAATSSNTLSVYFNQPIRVLTYTANSAADEFAFVDINGNGTFDSGVDGEIVATRAMNTDKTQWEVKIDHATPAKASYNLVLNTGAAVGIISNVDTTTRTAGMYTKTTSIPFAGTDSLTAYIKDVYAVATDARTLVVHFPEAMDEASVENTANYAVTTGSVIDAVYDDTTNSVTLKLSADVTTDQSNLVITNSTIKNAIKNKEVETDLGANLSISFARSTATPVKLQIASATVSGNVITVKMNQKFKTATNITANPLNLLKALAITVNNDEAVTTCTVETKLDTTTVADSSAGYIDTFVITVAGLNSGEQGNVDFNTTVTEALTAITGQIHDADADAVVFAQ